MRTIQPRDYQERKKYFPKIMNIMKRSVEVPKFNTWLREVMNYWREKNKALLPWIRSAVIVFSPPQASAPGYQ